ncbi:MAG: bifunctional diaminohydroxyphosphoribosylaminopyrimidine deaminase/5-amino-6-(5-phosphoribosylamino)uracil reductase RibD [Pseudomonadota bacterium]
MTIRNTSTMTHKKQESYMRLACELALKGAGSTSPNPIVGAVVVKDGQIVGEGFHKRAGGPHAEIIALRQAGKKACSADLYVTLEPCCHEGRTPPCVPAIKAAKISRVFVGSRDPNPLVNGKGIRSLRNAGITIREGLLKKECAALNCAHNKFMLHGVPFVTAKVALTLDGKIATSAGVSKWITNKACRAYVHELRSRSDVVMVGGNTIRKDNPKLNVRIKGHRGKMPKAVVIDETLNIPCTASVLKRRKGDLICVTTTRAPVSRIKSIKRMGHEVIVCRKTSKGLVDVRHALKELGKFGISSVLLEGGGSLFSSFIKNSLVDRLIACIAPKLLGGEGFDFLPGICIENLQSAIELSDVTFRTFDDNIVVQGLIINQ